MPSSSALHRRGAWFDHPHDDAEVIVRNTAPRSRDEDEVAANPDDLPIQLRSFLAKAGTTRTVVLFLDALNQLDPAHRSHALNWLPFYVPPGARLIVSTLEGGCHDALRNRQLIPDRELRVPSLTRLEREELIRRQLAVRSKQLTDEQLACLVDDGRKQDAGLPLYLQVAVEELSLCRDRRSVDRRVTNLPETVAGLFTEVLQRLEYDHTEDVTERALSLIAVSRSGLFESEIIDVLSAGSATFSKERWMRLYRALEFYLRPMDETNRSGLIDFYHDQLRTAVFHRYLRMASLSGAESAETARRIETWPCTSRHLRPGHLTNVAAGGSIGRTACRSCRITSSMQDFLPRRARCFWISSGCRPNCRRWGPRRCSPTSPCSAMTRYCEASRERCGGWP